MPFFFGLLQRRSKTHMIWIKFILVTLFWPFGFLSCDLPTVDDDDRILVLYDSGGPFSHVGKAHAVLLVNLLGHFDLPVIYKPVTQYTLGDLDNHTATFYLGATYEELSYYDVASTQWQNYYNFLTDAARTENPLIWINYNLFYLQQVMDEDEAQSFSDKFGFTPAGVQNNQFNRISYKNTELYKGVVPHANPGAILTGCIEEGNGMYDCATELNRVTITDDSKTTVYAWAYSTLAADDTAAYITQSGNFWFVGDLPFLYLSEEDRYLAFADLLHDMLKIAHNETHRALVRLEDVSANTPIDELKDVANYLNQASIPFSIATIAQYREKNTIGQDLHRSETGNYLKTLYRTGNVSIVAHGYTHQRDDLDNPYDGVSGNDFEFYRVTINTDNSLNLVGPIAPDTQSQNLLRMQSAQSILRRSGLNAFAWEAPHYLASPNGYEGIQPLFSVHYGRMTYYSNDFTDDSEDETDSSSQQMLGQFFPYIIKEDLYGYCIIPENIGNIEPTPIEGYRALFAEDLIRHAQKALVVRDGFASFFYHPYLGVDDLAKVVEGIKELGYSFTAADQLETISGNATNRSRRH